MNRIYKLKGAIYFMRKQVLLLALIFLISSVSASYIYGDIYISEDGFARLDIESDIPLNLEGVLEKGNKFKGVTETYDTIFIDIHFPNSLKSLQNLEGINGVIDFENRKISLRERNKKLTFKVNYALDKINVFSWIWILIIIGIVGAGYFLLRFKGKKRKLEEVFPYINDKERKILELLLKKSFRQKEVRKKLGIPKASFTRYVLNLEKKKLIIRQGEGKNKILKIK